MFAPLLTGIENGRHKCCLYYWKQQLPLFLSSIFFFSHRKRWFQRNGRHSLQGQRCLTDDKRSQDGHIICPVVGGCKKEMKASIFLSCHLFNFIITLGCLVWGQRNKKTTTWLSVATAEKCFQAKSIRRRWEGGRKREKISAYHVSVSRSRLGTRQGFSIMDKLLIRWELWPTLPSIYVCLFLHSSHPLPPLEFASYPRRVLFSLTGQLHEKMPK